MYAMDNIMGPILHTLYFMEAQRYGIKHNILLQDNHSTIRLEKNGVGSAGKGSKHLNVKFFFAHDAIKRGLLEDEYCPAEEMWADALTKPLQGRAFREMRSKLMNMPVD